jgi:hypothetical protein
LKPLSSPLITTTSNGALADGKVGEQYSAALAAATLVTNWKVSSGALPDGLSLNTTTGEITGTPTTAANSVSFSVIAEFNENGVSYYSSPVSFTITIAKGAKATPTGLTKTDETATRNDGTISGVTTEMQYKLSTASTYTDCSGTTITSLLYHSLSP